MYVCLCKNITDTQIRIAVEGGAKSLCALRNTLGVASQCGQCNIEVREIMCQTLLDNADNEPLRCAVSQAHLPQTETLRQL